MAAMDLERLLRWYVEAGVDDAVGMEPLDRYLSGARGARAAPEAQSPAPVEPTSPIERASVARSAAPATPLPPPSQAAVGARAVAAECADLSALRDALQAFEGCALKHTATTLVFADGNPAAPLMLIGEAPGADEDREGLPFVGAAGKLLDRMLGAVGLDRTRVYITNILPWRPPGNRTPTPNEVAICLPFLRRHIELVAPRLLVLIGGTSASTLLGTSDGITRIRGRWHLYRGDPERPSPPIPTMPIYHSAFLLRTPARKRDAWRDLVEIRRRLNEEQQKARTAG
jgi:DNA polymerase